MRCFYSSDLDLKLDLPSSHPFPGNKYSTSREMLLQGGILRPDEIIDVSQTNLHILKRVHDDQYLSKIYYGKLDRKEQLALGLPATLSSTLDVPLRPRRPDKPAMPHWQKELLSA